MHGGENRSVRGGGIRLLCPGATGQQDGQQTAGTPNE
jgi:hypothetical protein